MTRRLSVLRRAKLAPVIGRRDPIGTSSWTLRSNPSADTALRLILDRAARPKDADLDRLAVAVAAGCLLP